MPNFSQQRDRFQPAKTFFDSFSLALAEATKGDGKEAKLSYSGNQLVENRNGLIVNAVAWEATGTADWRGHAA